MPRKVTCPKCQMDIPLASVNVHEVFWCPRCRRRMLMRSTIEAANQDITASPTVLQDAARFQGVAGKAALDGGRPRHLTIDWDDADVDEVNLGDVSRCEQSSNDGCHPSDTAVTKNQQTAVELDVTTWTDISVVASRRQDMALVLRITTIFLGLGLLGLWLTK